MKTDLREKLVLHRDVKRIADLLGRVKSLECLNLDSSNEAFAQASILWRQISQINANPTSKLTHEASTRQVSDWLSNYLSAFYSKNKCFLCLGGFYPVWAEVHVVDQDRWLSELWDNLESKEVLFLALDRQSWLGVTEEEHFYDLYFASLTEH